MRRMSSIGTKIIKRFWIILIVVASFTSVNTSQSAWVTSSNFSSQGIVKNPSRFVYRGATLSIKHFFSEYRDYIPSVFQIIGDLNIDTIRVFSAGFSEFSMENTTNWAENLEGFLESCGDYGLRITFSQLGGRSKNDPMFGIYPGENIMLSKSKIDRLAGNNSLGKNFLEDPRIPLWIVANEPDFNDTNLLNWCQEIAGYIKQKGVNVAVGNPRIGYDISPRVVIPMIKDNVTHLIEHLYFWHEVQTFQDTGQNIYEHVSPLFQECLNDCLAVMGDMPKENLLIGEVGLPRGYYERWGTNFTEDTRGEYYHSFLEVSRVIGIGGVFPFNLFDTSTPDGWEYWGAVGHDGAYYTKVTNQYRSYY